MPIMDCESIMSIYKTVCEKGSASTASTIHFPNCVDSTTSRDCHYLRRLKEECLAEESYNDILFPKKPRVIVKHRGDKFVTASDPIH